MKRLTYFAMMSLALACLSCEPNVVPDPEDPDVENPTDDEEPDDPNTYRLPVEAGSTEITISTTSGWSLINDNSWLSFSKISGKAGDTPVIVMFEANPEYSERVGKVYLLDATKKTTITFKQRREDVIILASDTFYVPMEGTFNLKVGANVNYTVSSETPWIHCPETKAMNYSETALTFTLDKNPSTATRQGTVSFKAGDITRDVTFIQSGWVDVNWTSPFFTSVLGIRFTGTWCGWCPSMAHDVIAMNEQMPGRLNCICVYNGSGATLDTPEDVLLERFYGIQGFPSMVLSDRAMFSNAGVGANLQIFKNFSAEQRESYPSASAISLEVKLASGKLEIMPTVFSKETVDYRLHIAILENGIVAEQHDNANLYTSQELKNFVHNNVIKGYVTEPTVGDECSLGERSNRMFNYTVNVPSNIVDSKNIAVVAYTTRPVVDGPKAVSQIDYYKDKTEYVDNCVICPVNSKVNIKYE